MRRLVLAALAAALPARAQDCATDAMVVFDGSASMGEITMETGANTRIKEARRAMAEVMADVERVRRIGLFVYGPGGADSCGGVSLRFAPLPRAAARMGAELEALVPAGLTPLAAAVEAAAEAMDHRRAPAIVVLVTDGNETCGGRPCALADRLAAEAADLTVHVIGFRAARDFFAWDNPDQQRYAGDTVAKCLSDRTGGLFVGAETVEELSDALRRTLGCLVIGRL
ncbi:VWA domain-containing protein [Jannaschia sp. W003]|uniref:vWA domain-containing protein n=1 Tax=Jannaschia sp. W003 TaxID=2867012 RepID=UPI0021A94320|nr:VWA domain-containing protein [Jannaschia sp. W003]UWQ21226.1 VWA domain-containing protein [Jannaschia sp. W003]